MTAACGCGSGCGSRARSACRVPLPVRVESVCVSSLECVVACHARVGLWGTLRKNTIEIIKVDNNQRRDPVQHALATHNHAQQLRTLSQFAPKRCFRTSLSFPRSSSRQRLAQAREDRVLGVARVLAGVHRAQLVRLAKLLLDGVHAEAVAPHVVRRAQRVLNVQRVEPRRATNMFGPRLVGMLNPVCACAMRLRSR